MGTTGIAQNSRQHDRGDAALQSLPPYRNIADAKPAREQPPGSLKRKTSNDLQSSSWDEIEPLANRMGGSRDTLAFHILGLVALREASVVFNRTTVELYEESRCDHFGARELTRDDYERRKAPWVPIEARFERLLSQAGEKSMGEVLDDAAALLADYNPAMRGLLPGSYSAYRDKHLQKLVEIIGSWPLDDAGAAAFRRIYGLFLHRFNRLGAADPGTARIQAAVNIIENSQVPLQVRQPKVTRMVTEMIGRGIITDDGTRLGKIDGFVLDPATGKIEKILIVPEPTVNSRMYAGDGKGRLLLPFSRIEFVRDVVVVSTF